MDEETEKLSVFRITEQSRDEVDDLVVREFPLTVFLDGQELVTLLCSPTNIKYLAVGFLFSEGLIHGKDDIRDIVVDRQKGVVHVETAGGKELARELLFKRMITSGCGRGATFYNVADVQGKVKVESRTTISASEIFALVKDFQHRSQVFRATGGVHSAALCDTKNILVFSEDIGRHNAIDKIFGECLLNDIPIEDRIIVTSGRVSSEILLKVNKRNIPILISKSAPTDQGVKLAKNLGVTLVGFVRGKKMNVYAHEWRIVSDE
ncbi:MAG: formate dehydrogenase accessory sulfurtransferase FdhD [Chloroflexi bacterium]|nr:formate dehydrogenase accessory sulfurtransferase FdhD [Chloroflexota bacterium]MBM3153930.1 formate dehydrogenase accessory sulfurtransferase FdhD [Chloroflexota bacterium]MBM3173098.1 formate dehydrogenase accessory sulfurtransferase FdhD [Chloroflexota bacterium]MBM3175270.1 formate dehydrogenase accessory sulfurtransferase FdhD [Chloroflexota bacterium]MBM4450081.1 formate dehydrogenase accessory sulfurtransferase FdhD [Chloroflexota bacterium]